MSLKPLLVGQGRHQAKSDFRCEHQRSRFVPLHMLSTSLHTHVFSDDVRRAWT